MRLILRITKGFACRGQDRISIRVQGIRLVTRGPRAGKPWKIRHCEQREFLTLAMQCRRSQQLKRRPNQASVKRMRREHYRRARTL
jgi:hypothetical protein